MNWTNASTQHQEHPDFQSERDIDAGRLSIRTNLLTSAIVSVLASISTMRSVRRERKKLRHLSDDQLRDIGVCPRAAEQESNRSFFDIPDERSSFPFAKSPAEMKR